MSPIPIYVYPTPTDTRADQVTTVVHELTHAPGVFSPGTNDNAYGYSASIALSSSAAVLNADTYALYSQGEFAVLFFSFLLPRYMG